MQLYSLYIFFTIVFGNFPIRAVKSKGYSITYIADETKRVNFFQQTNMSELRVTRNLEITGNTVVKERNINTHRCNNFVRYI